MAKIDLMKRQRLLNEKFFEISAAKRKVAAAIQHASGMELASLMNEFLSVLEKETRLLQAAGLIPKDSHSPRKSLPRENDSSGR